MNDPVIIVGDSVIRVSQVVMSYPPDEQGEAEIVFKDTESTLVLNRGEYDEFLRKMRTFAV